MGLTRIQQLFSTEKTNRQNHVPAHSKEEDNLPQLLCSDLLLPNIDNLEILRQKNAEVDKPTLDLAKVKKEHGIGLLDDVAYFVVNKWRPQDLKSVLERQYGLNKDSKLEDYKKAAREYFQNKLGDVSNLSSEEIEKRYQEIEKEFYIQMTRLKGTDQVTNGIISAIIGELKANGRVKAAEDMIGLSSNLLERHTRARHLQMDALYNLTNRDAFGKAPENAAEYEHLVFANMNEQGVKDSLKEIGDFAKTINIEECKRLKALKKDPNITLTREQEDLLLKYENYLLAGYAGGYTGLSVNNYISQAFAEEQMGNIYNTTLDFGIDNEVFEIAYEFMESHPEIAKTVEEKYGYDFQTVMDKATGGNYSKYITLANDSDGYERVQTNGENRKSVSNNAQISETNYMYRSYSGDYEAGSVSQDTGKYQTETKENDSTTDNPIKKRISVGGDIKGNSESEINTKSENSTTKSSESNKTRTLEDAIKGGITELNQYRKENKNVTNLEICYTALNNDEANNYLKSMALKQFKAFNLSEKKYIHSVYLNSSAQMEVTKVMSERENAEMTDYKSIDAKKFAENKLKKEEEKENKIIRRDFGTELAS